MARVLGFHFGIYEYELLWALIMVVVGVPFSYGDSGFRVFVCTIGFCWIGSYSTLHHNQIALLWKCYSCNAIFEV